MRVEILTMLSFLLVTLSFLGSRVLSYTCTDACEISDDYVNDNYCDCSDCGDETDWDCGTCSCPTECGSFTYCLSTGTSTSGSSGGSNDSIVLRIDNSDEFVLMDINGTCLDDNILSAQSSYGCIINCSFSANREAIDLKFDCEDSNSYCSTWELEFLTIGRVESVSVNMDINPWNCQSWKFNLDNYTSTDLPKVRASTTTSAFSVKFSGSLVDAFDNAIILTPRHTISDSEGTFTFDLDLSNTSSSNTEWYILSNFDGYSKVSATVKWDSPNSVIDLDTRDSILEVYSGYASPLVLDFECVDCTNLTINLNGSSSFFYGESGLINSYFGIFCSDTFDVAILEYLEREFTNLTVYASFLRNRTWAEALGITIDSCNGTTFNFDDDTGVYYDWSDSGEVFRPYPYYTEKDLSHLSYGEVCQTARRGSECVADSVNLNHCCIEDSRYDEFAEAIYLVFGLGAISCALGLIGIIGVVYLYVHNIWQKNISNKMKGDQELIDAKKTGIFRKMEIVTLTCTFLAAVCDVLTVIWVINTGLQEEFQVLSVEGCYNTDASLKFSELSSLFYQIRLLGWLEVGFDVMDVMISLFFLQEEYRVKAEIRAQLKEMKKQSIELGKTNANQGTAQGTADDGFALDGPGGAQQPAMQNVATTSVGNATNDAVTAAANDKLASASLSPLDEDQSAVDISKMGSPSLRFTADKLPDKVRGFMQEKKCPAFVAANVTLFTFDFIITGANFCLAIYPALVEYFSIEESDRCYVFVDNWYE